MIGRNVRRALDAAGGVPAWRARDARRWLRRDPEVVDAVAAQLADLDVAVARGDVLGRHGPRAAVAVGLVLARVGRRRVTSQVVALLDPGANGRDLAAGFEEEGVPLLGERAPGDAASLARRAAGRSSLGIGIGADAGSLALVLSALPGRAYLEGAPDEARAFGHAAARLAARRPL